MLKLEGITGCSKFALNFTERVDLIETSSVFARLLQVLVQLSDASTGVLDGTAAVNRQWGLAGAGFPRF